MTNSTWKYSAYYAEQTEEVRALLDSIDDVLFDVQYARLGNKAAKRREAATAIVDSLKLYFKLRNGGFKI